MKKRGRPRQFDEDAVIDAMIELFWRQGFNATSLDDIASATGLNRPSLYRAFGNKTDMYMKCLNVFAGRMMELFRLTFENAGTLETGLRDFYRSIIEVYYSGSNEKSGLGCLVYSNAITVAPLNEDIQRSISKGLEQTKSTFKTSMVQHRPNHSEPTVDIAVEVALSTFVGLGVQVRAGKSRKDIESAMSKSILAIIKLLT